MQKSLRALFPVVFLMSASFLLAQTPYIQSANNAANYDPTAIAQGSMFVIFGGSLGPSSLVSATKLPLPNTLAGTSVTVKSGSTTLSCPMFYSSYDTGGGGNAQQHTHRYGHRQRDIQQPVERSEQHHGQCRREFRGNVYPGSNRPGARNLHVTP